MKKMIYLLTAVLLMLMLLPLGGCNNTPAEHIVVISGYHANAPTPDFDSAELYQTIYDACYSHGSVTVIVDDGDPHVAFSCSIDDPGKNLSVTTRRRLANTQTSAIIAEMKNAVAITPEVDTLSALRLAERALSAEGDRKIILLDNALSTTGYVDFTKNWLRAEPDTLVEYLRAVEAIPNLDGVDVKWIGIGDTIEPQARLTPGAAKSLQKIWEKILTEAGAHVSFPGGLPAKSEICEFPYVTTIPVPADPEPDPIDFDSKIIIDETKLAFLPDSTEFADENAAKAVMSPYAKLLKDNPENHIILAGTTAKVGSSDSCKIFSMKRAERIRDLFLSQGVSADQIDAVLGLGYDHKDYINDHDPDGTLNENAPHNRSVIIIDASTDEAAELIRLYS